MENLLSIVTFLPLIAALILAIFLRGEDELRTVDFTIEERPKWAVPR